MLRILFQILLSFWYYQMFLRLLYQLAVLYGNKHDYITISNCIAKSLYWNAASLEKNVLFTFVAITFYPVVALTIAHLRLCCCFVSSFLLVWKIMPACVMISMSPAAWDKNHNIGISSCSIKVAAFRFCIKWFNHYCALKQCPSQFWQLTLFQGRCDPGKI